MPATFKTMTMKFRDSPEDPWSASLVQAVAALDPAYEAMGIVEDGNTATHNISSGQYVIWKGELYTASTNITSGTTLSGSNLTAVSNGGFNSLKNTINQLIKKGSFVVAVNSGRTDVPNLASVTSGTIPSVFANAYYIVTNFSITYEAVAFEVDGGVLRIFNQTAQNLTVKWIEFT